MSNQEWTADNVREKIMEDIIKEGKVFEVLDKDTSKWIVKDFQNDGFKNFIFLVTDSKGKKILIKWTSPFIKLTPGYSLEQNRGIFERDYLILNSSLYPNSTPTVYFYSNTHYYFAMEYLEGFSNFKDALIIGEKNDNFATKVGEYLAFKSFKTSNLYLKPHEMLKNTLQFLQNTKTRLFVDYVNYGYYYYQKNTINYNSKGDGNYSDRIKKEIEYYQSSQEILLRVRELEIEMLENIQCVTHGDFHTGAVLMKDDQIYIIDSEAVTMGPIAYDIGILFGNIIFGYFFQTPFETKKDERKELKEWILKCICDTWDKFESKFRELWKEPSEDFKKKYFAKIFDSTIGYAAIILLRGALEEWPEYAHLKNFEREKISLAILSLVKLLYTKKYTNIKEVCSEIEGIKYE